MIMKIKRKNLLSVSNYWINFLDRKIITKIPKKSKYCGIMGKNLKEHYNYLKEYKNVSMF